MSSTKVLSGMMDLMKGMQERIESLEKKAAESSKKKEEKKTEEELTEKEKQNFIKSTVG